MSLWLCVQVFLYVFTVLFVCMFLGMRAQVCSFCVSCTCLLCRTWVLFPPPLRSKVFINLNSRRQITRPQAATHPSSSFQVLPKTAFNMHFSFPCFYKNTFSTAFYWFFLCAVGVCQREAWLWWCLQSRMDFQRYNFVLFEFMLSITPHWMTLSPVYSAYISCGALSSTSSWFSQCLFAYLSMPLSVWWCLRVFPYVWFWER